MPAPISSFFRMGSTQFQAKETRMPPPVGTSNTEIIRTTGEVQIVLSDSGPSITLETPTGTKILMGASDVHIKTPAGSIRIEGGSITINAAQIRLEAPLVTARILRCDTLIAESVVASVYTPGVGNIM
ncbi:hypothetical protein [Thermomonas sp.]|uniref:hypothetical protein n=1 Tax=Thermomonas sp. TaxID=1971895 RepID=UPI002487A678|nr:hypothetical protein [Thermomonas sp.]MDI1252819.1 hypothetical protein [Thermomonas sp.]